MPAKHVPTSIAVGYFLRDQRKRLGFTLRDVEEMSEKTGTLIPFSTLSRIEQGKLDPGLPRLQQLLRTYHVPIQAAGDLLDLESYAGAVPDDVGPKRLYEIGREASTKGDLRTAVAAFLALAHSDIDADRPLRQRSLLALSSVSGTLGKFRFAKQVIDELLMEGPDPEILVSVLVQAARCWQWLGSSEVAEAFIARAEGRLTRRSPAWSVAYVFHEKASILVGLRQFDDAQAALARALAAYRRIKHEAGYCQALGVRVRMRFEQNDFSRALMDARMARMYARRHDLPRLRMLFAIEEARAHLGLGNIPACLAQLGQVLADAVAAGDKCVRFYTHYYYWRAYEKLGDASRAATEFDEAARYIEFMEELTPEVRHLREQLSKRSPSRGRRSRKN